VDLYLVTSPDVPFVQDGFRDGEKIRDWMHTRFVEQLAGGPTPMRVLRGPYPGRLATAIAEVEAVLERPWIERSCG
jgi:nicotinamide riboside kinase